MYSIQTQNFIRNSNQGENTFEFKSHQFKGNVKQVADTFTKSQKGKTYEEPILDWLLNNVETIS